MKDYIATAKADRRISGQPVQRRYSPDSATRSCGLICDGCKPFRLEMRLLIR
jgi:hypothetical protein